MQHVETLDTIGCVVTETIGGGVYPQGRRTQLQVAYCHLVIEHQFGIAHLLEGRMFGSAFALASPTFEALVKGLWLFHCARDEQLEKYANGLELDDVAKLTESLLSTKLPPVITTSLHQVKSKYWKSLSSFAHVGHTQLKHWLNKEGVRANYPDDALRELANFAAFMSLAAGRELALRANNSEAANQLEELLPIYKS